MQSEPYTKSPTPVYPVYSYEQAEGDDERGVKEEEVWNTDETV